MTAEFAWGQPIVYHEPAWEAHKTRSRLPIPDIKREATALDARGAGGDKHQPGGSAHGQGQQRGDGPK